MLIARRALLGACAATGLAAPLRAQRGADVPFVVTPLPIVEAMLDLAGLQAGERLMDLGSGDGRIVLAAARRGAEATGVEIDGELVERARRRAELEGLQARARFTRGNLFEVSLRDADVVSLYLLTSINQRLRPKILTEMKAGARVVSHAFDMGDWSPDSQRIVDDKHVYLWNVPAIVGGEWRMQLGDGRSATLRFDQRFQTVVGEWGATAIVDTALRGQRFFFRAQGHDFHGLVGDRTITPDPSMSEGVRGWRAERI